MKRNLLWVLMGVVALAACGDDDDNGRTRVVRQEFSFSITASTTAALTQEAVRFTATGNDAALVTWSDNCRGDFSASDGTTATWTNTWAERCVIRASAGDVTQEVVVTTRFQPGTVASIAGTVCATTGAGSDINPFAVEEKTPAAEALFSHLYGALTHRDGGIYFSDRFAGRVFRFDPATTTVTVVAGRLEGNDGNSDTVNGADALSVALNDPWGLAEDAQGNLLIAEYGGRQIQKLFPTTGTMVTLASGLNVMALKPAGNGTFLYVGGNNSSNLSRFFPNSGTSFTLGNLGSNSFDISIRDSDGAIFTAQRFNNQILRIDPTSFATTVFAGTGEEGAEGMRVPATTATLSQPMGVFASKDNKVFIAERGNGRVSVVGPNGQINRIVGPGLNFVPGTLGPVPVSPAIQPTSVTLDQEGNLYFTDRGDCTLKRVSGPF